MRTAEDELLEYERLVAEDIKAAPINVAASSDKKPSNSWRVQIIGAKELQHKQFSPIRYVLPGYIPEGATLLVSRPKLGKSWLVLDLCVAISMDHFTLGMLKPATGDVLYLALEDGERRLQRRLTRLLPTFNGEWPSRLRMATEWPRADEGGIAAIEEWIKSVPTPTAVVVDTLQKLRKMQSANGNTYAADYEAVGQLQALASKYGIAIIIVHHDRKAGADDVFDTISGTQGLTGAADTIAIMKRDGRGVTLYVRGRDVEESETAIQFQKDSCRWTILGEAAEIYKTKERAKVIAALKASPDGAPMKVGDIIMAARVESRAAADTILHRMVEDGEIVRLGRGLYALPVAGVSDGGGGG